jgi:hypothetical protein
MVQVSLVGYAAGGAFLGMGYFDLPYHLMIIFVLIAGFSGVLVKGTSAVNAAEDKVPPHPSSLYGRSNAGQRP